VTPDLGTTVLQHLHHLAGELGPRSAGSMANHAAAAYILNVLERSGYTVETQEYPCPDWSLRSVSLHAGRRPLPTIVNPYSPACDVTAHVVAAASIAELENADCAGRICIIHGALTHKYLDPSYAVYISEPDPVATLLQRKSPVAVVAVNPARGDVEPLIVDWTFPIPSVTIDCETGREMLEHLPQKAHLAIDSTTAPSTSSNVIGHRAGTRPASRLILCAHFDTAVATPGAFDNGAGTAVLLGLASVLGEHHLHTDIELVFFSGEETGGVDAARYLEQSPALDDVLAVINLDGIGSRVGATGVVTMGGSTRLDALVRKTAAAYPGIVTVDPWYESVHSVFLWRGVPCIPLTTSGYPRVLHGALDNESVIDPKRLHQATLFTRDLVQNLQGKSPAWTRPSTAS
jgi:aminopeptidase YwaD